MLELTPKHMWHNTTLELISKFFILRDKYVRMSHENSCLNMKCEAILQHQDMSMSVAIRFREVVMIKDVPCDGP